MPGIEPGLGGSQPPVLATTLHDRFYLFKKWKLKPSKFFFILKNVKIFVKNLDFEPQLFSSSMDQYQSTCFGCKKLLCVHCRRELCLQCRRVGCELCIDPKHGCFLCCKQDEQKSVLRNVSLHQVHLIKTAKELLARMWEERQEWLPIYAKSRELHGTGFVLKNQDKTFTYKVSAAKKFQSPFPSMVYFAVQIRDALKQEHIFCRVQQNQDTEGGLTM